MQTIEKEICYSWTIKNFESLEGRSGDKIISQNFPFKTTYGGMTYIPNDIVTWHMGLYPRGVCSRHKNYVAIYLRKDSGAIGKAVCIFTLLKSDNTEIIKHAITCNTVNHKQEWVIRNLILRKDLCDNIDGSDFTILCKITYIEDGETIDYLEIPECRLLHNLGLLLGNEELCDVTLSVGKNNIGAHRAILAAQSPIFKALFTHDMAEKQHNKVEITDVRFDVLKDMLCFIYSGTVPVEKFTTDLLAAADKYELERLKLMCANALYRKLSVENACKIFIVADRHGVNCLKTEAVNFIIHNAQVLITTQEWETMSADHPHLVKEAFLALANHCHCKCACEI